jgi:hypothetical protein
VCHRNLCLRDAGADEGPANAQAIALASAHDTMSGALRTLAAGLWPAPTHGAQKVLCTCTTLSASEATGPAAVDADHHASCLWNMTPRSVEEGDDLACAKEVDELS